MNPRLIRAHFEIMQSKRVTVGLTTDHYLCGTWTALQKQTAIFRIGEREMTCPLIEIVNICEAPLLQTDFFK